MRHPTDLARGDFLGVALNPPSRRSLNIPRVLVLALGLSQGPSLSGQRGEQALCSCVRRKMPCCSGHDGFSSCQWEQREPAAGGWAGRCHGPHGGTASASTPGWRRHPPQREARRGSAASSEGSLPCLLSILEHGTCFLCRTMDAGDRAGLQLWPPLFGQSSLLCPASVPDTYPTRNQKFSQYFSFDFLPPHFKL